MFLEDWFKKHNISESAIYEFKYHVFQTELMAHDGKTFVDSEIGIQNLIRAEASEKGKRLWRNNNGATATENGGYIRFGLANDSSAINKVFKSSDLIGLQPIKITDAMVGKIIGQFLCREIKLKGWTFSKNDQRSCAQLAFINLINLMGGDAAFATGVGSL